ncbi:cerebellin-1-like [Engraulis encrasicolus]|uniref:cerebellin-1-like n=1 Tax=Engraulis encrasicolus TaxID=184585 RepID=UPI002FD0E94C
MNAGESQTTEFRTGACTGPDVWADMRELRRVMQEMTGDLNQQKVELQDSKREVEQLKQLNAAMEERLNVEIADIKAKHNAAELRLTSTEQDIGSLKTNISGTPKVAFSAFLTDAEYVGPFNTDIILAYKKIFTNIGNAYSPITGIFTAPVRGVYYFRFTGVGKSSSHSLVLKLTKNGEKVMAMYEYPSDNEYVNNGVVLQLEVGDVIYMQLLSSSQVIA